MNNFHSNSQSWLIALSLTLFCHTGFAADNSWTIPKEGSIPANMEGDYIRYGKELILNTQQYLGPRAKNQNMRYSGNNLACTNCHLQGGTRQYAAPFIGVVAIYPNYRKRENSIGTIEDRINGCMTRSLNGRELPRDSKEMKAMVSYMSWLSQGVAVGAKIDGLGFHKISVPNRAADKVAGKLVFEKQCQGCHGAEGQGIPKGNLADGAGYQFPPLWGQDSFNEGAGMHRVIQAAQFIKYNMPFGVSADNPVLSDAESFDVAAYINSFSRPAQDGKEKDFPLVENKPVDCPYPPYADNFSVEQHKIGPFQPIIAEQESRASAKKLALIP